MQLDQIQALRKLATAIASALSYPPAGRLDYLRHAYIHSGELLTAVLTNDPYFIQASLEEIALWLLMALPEQMPPSPLVAAGTISADEIACAVSTTYAASVRGSSYLPIGYHILYALRSVAGYPDFDLQATLRTKATYAERMRGIIKADDGEK